jgi:hypothetical protein
MKELPMNKKILLVILSVIYINWCIFIWELQRVVNFFDIANRINDIIFMLAIPSGDS